LEVEAAAQLSAQDSIHPEKQDDSKGAKADQPREFLTGYVINPDKVISGSFRFGK
jgi:hypothetical protein